jgi:hypothetical protein
MTDRGIFTFYLYEVLRNKIRFRDEFSASVTLVYVLKYVSKDWSQRFMLIALFHGFSVA